VVKVNVLKIRNPEHGWPVMNTQAFKLHRDPHRAGHNGSWTVPQIIRLPLINQDLSNKTPVYPPKNPVNATTWGLAYVSATATGLARRYPITEDDCVLSISEPFRIGAAPPRHLFTW